MQHKYPRAQSTPFLRGFLLALLAVMGCTTNTQQTKQTVHSKLASASNKRRYRIPIKQGLHISRGPQQAPIQIIEYLNPTHKQSRQIASLRPAIWRSFPGMVRWEVRLAPSIEKDRGYLYARALLAAHRYDSFWPYLQKLFLYKGDLNEAALFQIAEDIGLSRQHFELFLQFVPFKIWIEQDMRSQMAFGTQGEPALFVNGVLQNPPYTRKKILHAAKEALQDASHLLEQGTPTHLIYNNLIKEGIPLQFARGFPESVKPRRYIHLPFEVTEGIPFRGTGDAPIQIVEFSDFTCVPCRGAFLALEKLLARYPRYIRFYFKYYPIGIHAEGTRAAEAAAAAQAQRKFWDMYKILFQKQPRLLRGELLTLAREVGIDADWLSAELDRHSFLRRVRINAFQGRRLGIRGVPTIFLNGRQLLQPQSYEYIERVLREELWKKGIVLPSASTPLASR
ncbi:MAG: thioredoxin domain-containing protein [Myxococcales bacterium]|nr:thioredoxin domain-containing protein [Myxococcales bacterium]MCB9643029.1 thioredoxin domain-containing protein [Myxococcales bacterium]